MNQGATDDDDLYPEFLVNGGVTCARCNDTGIDQTEFTEMGLTGCACDRCERGQRMMEQYDREAER